MKKNSFPDPAHDELVAKLERLILDIEVAMVTTVTPDGSLHSRPMFTLEADAGGELWFLTSDVSAEATDIAEEHAVNVSYADPANGRYVSVTGQASILRDAEKVQELWKPALKRFFPQGPENPHVALLRV